MKRTFAVIIILQSFLSLSLYAQNIGFASGEIRYIVDRIKATTKRTITLNGGTIWGMNHFIIDMPLDDIIVVFSESSMMGVAYIDGSEKNVTFLGTTYSGRGGTNDIQRYGVGTFSYIKDIDTSGSLIELEDSTYWYVRPDQRNDVKDWALGERVILDSSESFIINLRFHEFASVVRAKVKYIKP